MPLFSPSVVIVNESSPSSSSLLMFITLLRNVFSLSDGVPLMAGDKRLNASKKPGELGNAMWDEIGTENGVFESGHCSDTVASNVARRDEENTKSGISCGQPYGSIDGRM
ncbi:hypothetical protein DsansV1_C30g0215881 [Dioscorea sansibarensis]